MGFYMNIQNEERATRRQRCLSTYANGLRLFRAIIREGILENIRLEDILFRSIATPGNEMFINNAGSFLDVEMSSEIEPIIEQMDQIRKEKDIRYPFFLDDNLETTVYWTGEALDIPVRGYITFREAHAEKAKELGRVEIDLFSTGKPSTSKYDDDVLFSEYVMQRIGDNDLEFDVLNRIISVVMQRSDESRYFRYREPTLVVASPSDYPMTRFYEAYAMGLRNERGLPKLFSSILSDLSDILSPKLVDKHLKKGTPAVKSLTDTFTTLSGRFLHAALSRDFVTHELMENSKEAEVTVTAGSLIVSSRDTLLGFLEAMVKTYDSVLTPIYELIQDVLKELSQE